MKKILSALVLLMVLSISTPVFATEGKPGEISGRSVGAAALSLLVWPGLGQLINENPKDKNILTLY